MAWLWESWDEYINAVHPIEIQQNVYNLSRHITKLDSVNQLHHAVEQLENAVKALRDLGFSVEKFRIHHENANVVIARNHVIVAVRAGEELLLYHKRLAQSEESYGFLHSHEILEHWDRYEKTKRITYEIYQFTNDSLELLEGYKRIVRADENFIVKDIELPEDLESDFRLARDLFSVGFDEVGLFVAGRGLESVLRRVSESKKILIVQTKGKPRSASEVDFADLIEVLARVRWKVRDTPLISKDTKTLLHYLRSIRNSQAHPEVRNTHSRTNRETAIETAKTASNIWNEISNNRAKLNTKSVIKDWP